ncbi:MAG: hypothetical protein GYA48_05940 [Chloroflexi bacterium]|nr:hypothetical protein [Chloroflexota bacterium]
MMARAGFVFANVLFFLLLLIWPVLSLVALFVLRGKPVKDTARALWALVITAIPLLGALAFFIAADEPDSAD